MSETIAFVFAMPLEFNPLKRKLDLKKISFGGFSVHSGIIEDRSVVGIVTGMGTRLATKGVNELFDNVEVDRIVVVGITGAVADATPIGTLIVPEVVVDSATGDEFQPDHIGKHVPEGKMWTTDELTTGRDAVSQLRAGGVVSLDMETAAIARVCQAHQVPWSVFRVISDRATDGSVDEEVFAMSNQDGTPNARAVAAYIIKHPGRVPTMFRMGRNVAHAARAAVDAAVEAVDYLPPGSDGKNGA